MSREEARNCLKQHVSSSLSKIPYVGFSPVRLQTGIQPRPSPTSLDLSTMPAYTQTTLTYTQLQWLWQKGEGLPQHYRRRISRPRETISQSALPSSINNDPVQSPLAHRQVMLSRRVIAYYGLIRNSHSLSLTSRSSRLYSEPLPDGMVWTENERLPNLLCLSLLTCRLPYPGGPNDWIGCSKSLALVFAYSAEARHPQPRTRRFSGMTCNL